MYNTAQIGVASNLIQFYITKKKYPALIQLQSSFFLHRHTFLCLHRGALPEPEPSGTLLRSSPPDRLDTGWPSARPLTDCCAGSAAGCRSRPPGPWSDGRDWHTRSQSPPRGEGLHEWGCCAVRKNLSVYLTLSSNNNNMTYIKHIYIAFLNTQWRFTEWTQ